MKNVFAGVGISKKDDPFEAGKEAVEKAIEDMKRRGGKEPVFGLVFCSGGKYGKDDKTIQKLVDGAHSVFDNTPWVGCTTAGEISIYGAMHDSVTAMIISSEYLRFGIGIGRNVGKDPKKAGVQATEDAFRSLKLDVQVDAYLQYMRVKKRTPSEIIKMLPYALIVLGKGPEKGLIPNIPKMYDLEKVIEGVIESCGTQIPISGGGSFDDWHMKRNYHFANGKIYKNAILVIALLSNVYFSSGLAHGYKTSGKTAFVNDTKKIMGTMAITKLNNRNALEEYSKLSGLSIDEVKKNTLSCAALHPFGIVDPAGESWIKIFGTVMMGDLLFSCDIKKNSVLHVMEGSMDDIFNAYNEAIDKALKSIGKKKPALVLVFSCACRNKFLGKKIGKEIDLFKKHFPDVPMIGFYTFDEFGGTLGNRMGVHTQSVTILIITDDLMI